MELTVAAVNDAPVAGDDAFDGKQGEVITGNVLGNDSDIDGDVLRVEPAIITTAAGATVVLLADGSFTYTPAAGYNGLDSFEYLLTDGELTDTAMVTLNIEAASNPLIEGDNGNNVLIGGAEDNIIYGYGGADLLDGGAGNDTLYYHADAKWPAGWGALNVGSVGVDGTNQFVSIKNYNRSYDVFHGGEGFDVLVMGSGNDALFLDDAYSPRPEGTSGPRISGIELIDAGAGNDVIDLTSDLYDYGDVTILGGEGNDVLWSSAGNDRLYGEQGNDNLFGGAGDDLLDGGQGNDTLDGGLGNDLLYGGEGNDTLYGGEGDDLLDGGNGNDKLYGGAGNDILLGGNGNDTLYGDAGNDILDGGQGNDTLYGGDGNDILIGGQGNDTLYGGDGADMFVFTDFSGSDRVKDFRVSEGDSLNITDLLQGYDPLADVISDFVKLVSCKGEVQLKVNADGHGNDFKLVAVIEGGVDDMTVSDLLDQGHLIVNQSAIF